MACDDSSTDQRTSSPATDSSLIQLPTTYAHIRSIVLVRCVRDTRRATNRTTYHASPCCNHQQRKKRPHGARKTRTCLPSTRQTLESRTHTIRLEQINTGPAPEVRQKTPTASQINRSPWPSTTHPSPKQDSTTSYEIHHGKHTIRREENPQIDQKTRSDPRPRVERNTSYTTGAQQHMFERPITRKTSSQSRKK